MKINQEIISIAETIYQNIPVLKIYLFGSYAYGTPTEDSDYDFFVIIPDNDMRPMEAMQKAQRAVAKRRRNVPIDILASTQSNFITMCGNINTVEKEVFQKGVLIYER